MAEFCLDCYNRLQGTRLTEREVRTEWDLCEGCESWKPVVISFRRPGPLARLYRRLEAWAWKRWGGRE